MEFKREDLPEEIVEGLDQAVEEVLSGPTVEVDPGNDYEDK